MMLRKQHLHWGNLKILLCSAAIQSVVLGDLRAYAYTDSSGIIRTAFSQNSYFFLAILTLVSHFLVMFTEVQYC